jgi:hypothetical protein
VSRGSPVWSNASKLRPQIGHTACTVRSTNPASAAAVGIATRQSETDRRSCRCSMDLLEFMSVLGRQADVDVVLRQRVHHDQKSDPTWKSHCLHISMSLSCSSPVLQLQQPAIVAAGHSHVHNWPAMPQTCPVRRQLLCAGPRPTHSHRCRRRRQNRCQNCLCEHLIVQVSLSGHSFRAAPAACEYLPHAHVSHSSPP